METVSVTGIESWQQASGRLLLSQRCSASDPAFSARIEQRELASGARVSRVETGAYRGERPASLISSGSPGDLLLLLQLSGQLTLRQRGREATASVGTMLLCEADAPARFVAAAPGQSGIVLQLTAAQAGIPAALAARVSAVPIAAEVPGQVALRGLLTAVQDPRLVLDPDTSESLVWAVGEVLGSVARALAPGARPPGREPRERRDRRERRERLAVLRDALRAQLADPGITVERIAAQHFLSVRQVHSLFAAEADSPAAFLRRARLAHAERLLLTRHRSGLTVRAVARASGYSDTAAFIRAFTRARGLSPARWAETGGAPEVSTMES